MTELQIMMTFMGLGFTGMGTLVLYLHSKVNTRMDKLEARMDRMMDMMMDIDRRLCRLEGAFSNKECCILRHDHKEKVQ